MTRPARTPAPVTCPSCGWVSLGAPHYCQNCGLDYWRSAAAGAPTLRALPPPPPPDRRLNGALITAGVAGLLVAGIATAAFVLGGMESDAPQIANTRPTARPGQHIIERFFREVRSPYAAYMFRAEGTMRQSEPPAEFSFVEVATMNGSDWISALSMTSDGVTTESGVAEIDGEYYVRQDTGEWQPVGARQTGPDGPFKRISTVGEVEYLGAERVGGVTLHRLLVTKSPGEAGTDWRLAGFGRLTERDARLDVWVTDGGVPVRATRVMTHTLTESQGTRVLTMDETIIFENWGLTEPIQPPAAA